MAIDWRSERRSEHVVCCIASGRGHVTAMVNLARAMARLGVSVTIVFSSESAYASVVYGNEEDPGQGLDVAFVLLEGSQEIEGWKDGARLLVKGVRKFSFGSAAATLNTDFSAEEQALEDLILAMPTPPIALISDMIVSWSSSPAQKLNLKRFVFYPAAPFYLAALLKSASLILAGVDPASHSGLEIDKNLPVIPWPQVPDYVKEKDHPFFNRLPFLNSDGILLNTFNELDGKVLHVLQHMPEAKGVQMFPVGPLIHPLFLDAEKSLEMISGAAVFKGSRKGDMKCLDWLEKKAERTVLFLCFGSWETLEDAQIFAIAKGLEASKHPFIWVTAESSIAALPEGFPAENEGLIVTDWAPQQLILRHAAIGGFLTHCGWNSIVECITIAGIPMVCWPFMCDQPFACRYVVDELQIGIEVEATAEGFVSADEVERCARIVMEKHSGIRERAAALKTKAVFSRSGLPFFLKSILSVVLG